MDDARMKEDLELELNIFSHRNMSSDLVWGDWYNTDCVY